MIVKVQSVQREGHSGCWRAGRFWPSGEALTVEVLSQEEDPPQLEEPVFEGGIKVRTRLVHDMTKIGRKSYAAVKADPRLRILADGETQSMLSAEAVAKAQAVAGELAKENASLKVASEALKQRVAELEAMVESLTKPQTEVKKPEQDAKGKK